MAILVNKMNLDVKIIIPNMREFRTFYSDNDGVIGMFFKQDWEESTKQEEHWKPSEDEITAIEVALKFLLAHTSDEQLRKNVISVIEHLKQL